jgi:hypothetical protein
MVVSAYLQRIIKKYRVPITQLGQNRKDKVSYWKVYFRCFKGIPSREEHECYQRL